MVGMPQQNVVALGQPRSLSLLCARQQNLRGWVSSEHSYGSKDSLSVRSGLTTGSNLLMCVAVGLVGAWNHLVLPNAMMFDGTNVARSLVSDSAC